MKKDTKYALLGIKLALISISITIMLTALTFIIGLFNKSSLQEGTVWLLIIYCLVASTAFLIWAWKIKIPKN